ncbi:MAG: hypothetical protein ACKV22_39265 [Bryobacteraceae bacterium]
MAAVAVMLLAAPSSASAEAPCSIEGSWITGFADPPGPAGLETDTLIPLDPFGHRLAYRGTITNPSVWTPFAPKAAVLSAIVGTFVRTGPRAYKFNMIMHAAEAPPAGAPGRGRITTLARYRGTAECRGGNTLAMKGTFTFFSALDVPEMGIHNQDQDHDGFPDKGEVPLVSVPVELVSKRVLVD